MKFSMKDFFIKYDQICSFLRIWSHLLKKYLMENFIFLWSDPSTCLAFFFSFKPISNQYSTSIPPGNIRKGFEGV